MRRSAVLLASILASLPFRAHAGPYRDGWTDETVSEAVDACTESLVQGAWENTKRDQGVDPARKLTPDIRAQLAPQIEAFRGLCACTVKETAKKYGQADYARQGPEVERYAVDLVKRGVCKGPQ